MNPSATLPSNTTVADQDLAEQARPGCGIPSQDPRPEAQHPLQPEEAEREAKSVLVGGGVMAGAATGAAPGIAVAGPVGVMVGGTLGAVAGALSGAAASSMVNTASVASRSEAAEAERPLRPHTSSTGAARPPAAIAPASAGRSRRPKAASLGVVPRTARTAARPRNDPR